jgi:hypothetical protein
VLSCPTVHDHMRLGNGDQWVDPSSQCSMQLWYPVALTFCSIVVLSHPSSAVGRMLDVGFYCCVTPQWSSQRYVCQFKVRSPCQHRAAEHSHSTVSIRRFHHAAAAQDHAQHCSIACWCWHALLMARLGFTLSVVLGVKHNCCVAPSITPEAACIFCLHCVSQCELYGIATHTRQQDTRTAFVACEFLDAPSPDGFTDPGNRVQE